MSSDNYGLQDTEFRTKSLPVIIAELMDSIRSLMGGRVSLLEDDPLYQFLLVAAQREERLWRLSDTLFQLSSISGASGLALDRHGEDLALPRGGATHATTNILLTGTPGNDIALGSIFETDDGIQFETTEAAELPLTIPVVRATSGNRESIPSPYSGLLVVDWVSDSSSGSSPYNANVDYNIDGDIIDWSPVGLQPDPGATYYVRVSSSISVTIAVQSIESGLNQNVPANTIISVVSDVGGVDSVTNTASTGTTGQDSESDSSYKLRLLRAGRRNWTDERIRSKIEEISGVASAMIFIGDSVDQHNLQEDYTVEMENLGQLFRPGERIGSISACSLYTRVFGTPGDLMVELYNCQRDALGEIDYDLTLASARLAYSRIASSDIDPLHATTWFEHKTALKYNHLDNTRRYMLLIYSLSDNATNYYEFRYGIGSAYAYGGLYRNGILHETQSLYFKTRFPTASFTPVIAPTTTLDSDLEDEIEAVVTATGKAVSIQCVIEEATIIRVQIEGRLKIDEDSYTFAEITSGIETRLYNYLTGLEIGNDVIWSEVVWCIMEEPGVQDIDDIIIKYKRPVDATFNSLAESVNLRIEEKEIARQDTVGVLFQQFWSGD